jgi:hypothetical protein
VLLVATAALAKFLELKTASGRLLVLGGCVVALLALGALQCHDFPHLRILTDSVWICSTPLFLNFRGIREQVPYFYSLISIPCR